MSVMLRGHWKLKMPLIPMTNVYGIQDILELRGHIVFFFFCILTKVLRPLKGMFTQKMNINPWFTQPQAILVVYDFLLSGEY